MTESKTYNGWTNYETWAVALWIGNEEGSYVYWEKEQAEECYKEAVEDDSDADRQAWTDQATYELARRMKDQFTDEENCSVLGEATVYSDLLRAALSEVNWDEIARNYVEGLDREEIEKDILPEPEDTEEPAEEDEPEDTEE